MERETERVKGYRTRRKLIVCTWKTRNTSSEHVRLEACFDTECDRNYIYFKRDRQSRRGAIRRGNSEIISFYFLAVPAAYRKFLCQGSNLSCYSNEAGFLTFCATRELHWVGVLGGQGCHSCGKGGNWGTDSIPGPETYLCHGCSQKTNQQTTTKNVW